tara:strand:- start:8054 stop:8734 length:681 start_codon:yes stop_codon:yes gene_type:complete
MIPRSALWLWVKEAVAGPFRYLHAVSHHPTVKFYPGVRIGAGCTFGRAVSVYAGATVADSVIGDNSYVGGGSTLKSCTVGKFCSIGPNVRVGLGIHPTDRVSTYPGFYSEAASGATKYISDATVVEILPVTIGNDVWIGANAIVSDGVNIGDGAVIAAGAVVTANVMPYSIVGGVPAKFIRSRFDREMVKFLQNLHWWDLDDETLRKHASLMGNPAEFRKAMENFV